MPPDTKEYRISWAPNKLHVTPEGLEKPYQQIARHGAWTKDRVILQSVADQCNTDYPGIDHWVEERVKPEESR